jgi:hypothetical protein
MANVRSLLRHSRSQPFKFLHIGKGIAVSVQAYYRPREFQEVDAPRFQDNWHMKVVRLSAPRTGRLYHPRNFSWHSFLLEAVSTPRPQCSQKDWSQWKIPKTSLGMKPVTFCLVVQCLNQIHHHMPLLLHTGNKKLQYYLNQKRPNDRITSSLYSKVFSGSQQVSVLPTHTQYRLKRQILPEWGFSIKTVISRIMNMTFKGPCIVIFFYSKAN